MTSRKNIESRISPEQSWTQILKQVSPMRPMSGKEIFNRIHHITRDNLPSDLRLTLKDIKRISEDDIIRRFSDKIIPNNLSDEDFINEIRLFMNFVKQPSLGYTKSIYEKKWDEIAEQEELAEQLFSKKVELTSQAYPNYDEYIHVPGQHNTEKWMQSIKDLYFQEKQGTKRSDVIKQITAGWAPTETYDFLNWLKFYEEGNHLKYKIAQSVYENPEMPGYFLHIKNSPPESNPPVYDVSAAKDAHLSEISPSQRKHIIQKQRNKIISRLDSAEKLLRSDEGDIFAGKELESLIETIYNLKKKVQLVNKISTSSKLYEDMIVREANILVKKGFDEAAELLFALAEDKKSEPPPPADTKPTAAKPATPPPPADTKPAEPAKSDAAAPPPPADAPTSSAVTPAPPAPPAEGSGSAGGLPAAAPGEPNSPTAPVNDTSPGAAVSKPKGINDFLKRMQTSNITTTNDNNSSNDNLEVDEASLFTEAQTATLVAPPVAPPVTSPNKAPVEEAPLEVSEEDVKPTDKPIEVAESDFDNKVNDIFSNIKINDVVVKLEDLSKIFKTREIPRQLAIVDMMLDSLGLASYFPSLSEATNKALESNNYISTRVDDILSKLRGSMETHEINLKGDGVKATNPEVESLKNNLEEVDSKEKARKELRKQQELEELNLPSKETPEIEIEEAPVASVTPPSPAPVATK